MLRFRVIFNREAFLLVFSVHRPLAVSHVVNARFFPFLLFFSVPSPSPPSAYGSSWARDRIWAAPATQHPILNPLHHGRNSRHFSNNATLLYFIFYFYFFYFFCLFAFSRAVPAAYGITSFFRTICSVFISAYYSWYFHCHLCFSPHTHPHCFHKKRLHLIFFFFFFFVFLSLVVVVLIVASIWS